MTPEIIRENRNVRILAPPLEMFTLRHVLLEKLFSFHVF